MQLRRPCCSSWTRTSTAQDSSLRTSNRNSGSASFELALEPPSALPQPHPHSIALTRLVGAAHISNLHNPPQACHLAPNAAAVFPTPFSHTHSARRCGSRKQSARPATARAWPARAGSARHHRSVTPPRRCSWGKKTLRAVVKWSSGQAVLVQAGEHGQLRKDCRRAGRRGSSCNNCRTATRLAMHASRNGSSHPAADQAQTRRAPLAMTPAEAPYSFNNTARRGICSSSQPPPVCEHHRPPRPVHPLLLGPRHQLVHLGLCRQSEAGQMRCLNNTEAIPVIGGERPPRQLAAGALVLHQAVSWLMC